MEKKFVAYEHHGTKVWVQEDLKGKHREICLCYSCKVFNPGVPEDNCPIANLVYAVCIAQGLVIPVFECPEFVEGKPYPFKYPTNSKP